MTWAKLNLVQLAFARHYSLRSRPAVFGRKLPLGYRQNWILLVPWETGDPVERHVLVGGARWTHVVYSLGGHRDAFHGARLSSSFPNAFGNCGLDLFGKLSAVWEEWKDDHAQSSRCLRILRCYSSTWIFTSRGALTYRGNMRYNEIASRSREESGIVVGLPGCLGRVT
jgi:hypothetical protein